MFSTLFNIDFNINLFPDNAHKNVQEHQCLVALAFTVNLQGQKGSQGSHFFENLTCPYVSGQSPKK